MCSPRGPRRSPGHVNADGAANVTDLLAVLSAWGTHTCGAADADGNGIVNVTDVLVVLAAWGECSP